MDECSELIPKGFIYYFGKDDEIASCTDQVN